MTSTLSAISRPWAFLATLVVCALTTAESAELAGPIEQLLAERCIDCHDSETKKGGVDLEELMANFDPRTDVDPWVKVESAIAKAKMPPPKKKPLEAAQVAVFGNWFETEFVTPGGVQHAGPNHPRRLTREELQNTLEDILHLDLRETVTNSRLHVIPDTVIEKFFAAGVYGASGFSNDAVTLSAESIDVQTYARCFSLVLGRLDSDEEARKRLFGTATLPEKIPLTEARKIIDAFGRAAFRRPLSTEESAAFAEVYQQLLAKRTSAEAIKSSMLAILLSPPFFYRFEEPAEGQTPVVGEELAVRLSYFLWSAPPDGILLDLAAKGELRNPEVLQQQVRRMLADPKRIALAENLGGEWFDYKKLRQQSAINKRSDQMAGFYRTQYEEALLFFDSLIRYDQSVFDLVGADWTFINPHTSRIYRLATAEKSFTEDNALPPINLHYRAADRQIAQGNYEYKHIPLTLVGLDDADRGGFITIGSTLSATSTLNRTSPIRRGVWVMERILGEKFEQPEDVPDLEESQKKASEQKLDLTHNEILRLHSSQEGCASCHKHIDPIGFGLEAFDQLGISRVNANPLGEKHSWTPTITPRADEDRSWDLARQLAPGTAVQVFFQWTKGAHRLDIQKVRLESGNVQLVDAHKGSTGTRNNKNVWFFTIPKDAPKSGWKLTATVHADGGTDSNGVITVSLPTDKPSQQLPNGKTFKTPGELKQLLLIDYRDEIVDNAIGRVLAYALGRRLEPTDRPAIRKIKQSIAAQDFGMMAVIEAVALSYPFRHKEAE